MIDLQPMDIVCSYKPISGWWPPHKWIEHLMDYGILKYGESLYPSGDTRYNHTRLYIGVVGGREIGFEWTAPCAKFFTWKDWMTDPSYGTAFRFDGKPDLRPSDVFSACLPYDGTLYDFLQPVGMVTGWSGIDVGKKNMVCSVGARYIAEKLFDCNEMFEGLPVWQTPPASFANSSRWRRLN